MFRFRAIAYIVAALCCAPFEIQAATILIDFGGPPSTTFGAAPANDPARYWNTLPTTTGQSDTGQLLNLIDTTNAATPIDLLMIARFNALNTAGTTASPLYPSNATSDSLFGNTEVFNGITNVFPSFKIVALNPGTAYDFSFFASRVGAGGDNRTTRYTVSGAGAPTAVELNASENVSNTVTAAGIFPTAGGEITIALTPATSNNNASHFTYLNVLRIDSVAPVAVPEPSTFALLGIACCSAFVWSVSRRR